MSNVKVFPDVEGPIRDWVRAESITNVGTRVFFGLPERCEYPAIDLHLVDGGIQPGEAPLADVLVTFSVWGGQRIPASEAVWALAASIENLTPVVHGALALLGGVVVLGPVYQPDPDGRHRYLLDGALTVRPAT